MPNRPDDPYVHFPPAAAIGLGLMLAGGGTLLFLSATWQDWRQAILGALVLFGLIGAALLLRRVQWPSFRVRKPMSVPPTGEGPAPLQGFDPAGFVEVVRRQQGHSPPRRIEAKPAPDGAAERQQAKEEGTIRRLQDLRDHPATPDAERQAAEAKLKKARTKRRSAWKAHP